MLQEHQINTDIPHQDQENLIFSSPSAVRSGSPLSKSDIKFNNRIQMIKSTQSPRKEHLQLEISKLRDQSKKLLEMIESMGKREMEKNKKIQNQNSIISDLKLRLMQQSTISVTQSENPETNKQNEQNEEENEVFLVLLEEMKHKQEEIDLLHQRINSQEEQIKSIQLQQINISQVQQQQEATREVDAEETQATTLILNTQNIEENSINQTELMDALKNNESQIGAIQKIVEESQLELRKNAITIHQLTDTNKSLVSRVKQIEDSKGAGFRSFLNFIKELFIVIIISAFFTGLKYYVSIL